MNKVSFFTLSFSLLLVTYFAVAGLIAFFTVKIVGIPIGKKMFTKIVLTILAFTPLYIAVALLLSKVLERDLKRLSKAVKNLPSSEEMPESFVKEVDDLAKVLSLQSGRIKDLLEAQRMMLYRIAHDLKTPVTNLKNVLLAMKDGVISEDERGFYTERLIAEADKINTFLNRILEDLKKISRNLEREKVNLCAFLKDVEVLWKFRFERKGINLKIECKDNAVVEIPPADLEEILNNLLENSLNHTKEGFVKIEAFRRGEGVVIRVEDTGTGISQPKLREAYRRGSLGLYIVRELTWKNGGNLKIHSSEKGTVAELEFISISKL